MVVSAVCVGVRMLTATAAYAVTNPPVTSVTDSAGVANLLCNIVAWFFWIVLTISVIMVLYAAYTYTTAADDQEKTSKARRTLTYAAVGIAVALIAVNFPSIVSTIIPGEAGISTSAICAF